MYYKKLKILSSLISDRIMLQYKLQAVNLKFYRQSDW